MGLLAVCSKSFCDLAKKACGEKQLIHPVLQHTLSDNNNPHLDLHHKSSTCSRENKGTYFLRPCQLVRADEYEEM